MFSKLPITLAQLQAGNNSQKLKNKIRQLLYSRYCSKKINQNNLKKCDQYHLKMETVFMNTENNRTNESNKFSYYFIDKRNLKTLVKILRWLM